MLWRKNNLYDDLRYVLNKKWVLVCVFASNGYSFRIKFHKQVAGHATTSANLLIFGVMLFTREGVSETNTTLGLDSLSRVWVAFLMQFNAACRAPRGLLHRMETTCIVNSYKSSPSIINFQCSALLRCMWSFANGCHYLSEENTFSPL